MCVHTCSDVIFASVPAFSTVRDYLTRQEAIPRVSLSITPPQEERSEADTQVPDKESKSFCNYYSSPVCSVSHTPSVDSECSIEIG